MTNPPLRWKAGDKIRQPGSKTVNHVRAVYDDGSMDTLTFVPGSEKIGGRWQRWHIHPEANASTWERVDD